MGKTRENNRLWFISLFFLFSLICCDPGSDGENQIHYPMSLRIVHVNDTHSHLEAGPQTVSMDLGGTLQEIVAQTGSYPRLATMVEHARESAENTLFLHAGDLVQGTIFFNVYNGVAGVNFMNMMGLDAMVVGNHEFDHGPGLLANLIGQADFPFLGANVDVSEEPLLDGRLFPYIIREFEGQKVGLIGLVTKTTATSSQPGDTIRFLDETETARRTVAELDAKNVNKIIVISHIGYEEDIALARDVSGIDVILGGHSHTLLGDFGNLGLESDGPYPTLVGSEDSGDPVCIVQSWRWANVVGHLDVAFDSDGVISSCTGTPIMPLDDKFTYRNGDPVTKEHKTEIDDIIAKTPALSLVSPDVTAVAVLAEYQAGVEEFRRKVVGHAAENLWHVRVPGWKHPEAGVLPDGSYIAPHVATSMLEKVNRAGLKARIALINAGGVRTDIRAGDMTVADCYELLPYGNTLAVVDVKGSTIKNALEEWVYSETGGSFPYLAGARYSVDMNHMPGERVTSIELEAAQGQWDVYDPEAIYRVVTISFISFGQSQEIYRYDTGFVDVEAYMEYSADHDPLVRIPTNVHYIPQD